MPESNDDRVSGREFFAKLNEYHSEIVAFAEKTAENVRTLDDATKIINAQKDTMWSKFKSLLPIIAVIIVIIGLFALKPAGVCELTLNLEKGMSAKQCSQTLNK